jgi:hypothetical protein
MALTKVPETRQAPHREKIATGFAATCCLLFVGLGLAVIRYPGIQNDEALFATPLFAPRYWFSAIRLFRHSIPTMLMSYMGTLKTLLYWPWFHIWPPSAMSIRFPVLLAGAASVWLTFLLARRVSGHTVAAVTALLLATDVSFLLTSCFDWGPVALQHALLVSGVFLLVKFHQDGRNWALYLGFYLLGLGLWDKALFVWMLAGLVVAAVSVFPKEIIRHLSLRRLTLSFLCFVLGAFPLVYYNLKHHGETARSNISLSANGIGQKIQELRISLDGSVMLGLVTDDAAHPRSAYTAIERVSAWVHRLSGDHYRNCNEYAFLVAVLLLPLLWRTPARRPMLFAIVFLAATWAQMAFTADAGGSVHHVILLWPFPLFFIAVAFVEISKRLGKFGRPLLALVIALMAGQNLLIYNTCLAGMIRNGTEGYWTDAIYALSVRLRQCHSSEIDVTAWGMMNSLRLLDHGTLRLNELGSLLRQPEWRDDDRKILLAAISDPDRVFVNYTDGQEASQGVSEKLSKFAHAAGYERTALETIADRNRRPVFELFRFKHEPEKLRSSVGD